MSTTCCPSYRKPTGVHITQKQSTRDLYVIEARAITAVKTAALKLGSVLGFEESQLYTHSLPEELLNVLDAFDCTAAELAAIALLESRGYSVKRPAEEDR